MSESITPALLPTLETLLSAHQSAFRQARPRQRATALALGQLMVLGRHTLTQTLTTLGLGEADWSAFYRLFSVPRLDYDELTHCFLQETLRAVPSEQPYLVAVDGVQLPRHSRTMPGTSWQRDPHTPPFFLGIHRAQRFVHLAWLTPPSTEGYSRAVPLRWEPAFPEKAVRPDGLAARKEWEAGLDGLGWLRTELDGAGRGDQRVLGIADGLYSNRYVWAQVPERVSLLARCAKNRALYALPTPSTGRGRPRKYGERARRPDDWLSERRGWRTTPVAVRGRSIPLTYRTEGPYLVKGAPEQPLYLLVVRGMDQVRRGQRRRRKPAFWLVSAIPQDGQWVLPWPVTQLLAWAWQRWEIEVAHRELKSGFGVGEQQHWSATGAVVVVQWMVWCYSLFVLAGYRVWGMGPGPIRGPGRWWRGGGRWSLNRLWQGLRHELWGAAEFRPVWARPTANWWELADWLAARDNATLGAQRA